MTCEDLQKYIEENFRFADSNVWSDSSIAAHVAACAGCRHFLKERQSLVKNLQLVRDSIGSLPESLDAAVLAGYRLFVAEREETARLRKPYFPLIARWGVVAALALTVAVTALFVHRKLNRLIVVPSPVRPSMTIPAVTAQTPTVRPQIREARRFVPPTRKHSVSPEARSVREVAPIPDDFRGLMYCDELSCNGAMDMIRVQLPPSMIARPSAPFRRTSGPVNADVLIGPDGIARGIRIEERQF